MEAIIEALPVLAVLASRAPDSAQAGNIDVTCGLSAVLLMLLTGRIVGISGIFGGLLNFRNDDKGWRVAFIAGIVIPM